MLADRRTWRIAEVGIPVDLHGAIRRTRTIASRTGDGGRWRLEGDLAGDVGFSFDDGRVVAERDERRIAGRATVDGDAIRVEYGGGTYRFVPIARPRIGLRAAAKGGRGERQRHGADAGQDRQGRRRRGRRASPNATCSSSSKR